MLARVMKARGPITEFGIADAGITAAVGSARGVHMQNFPDRFGGCECEAISYFCLRHR